MSDDSTEQELHPVLVSEVADESARTLLRSVAARRGVALVPLAAPPAEPGRHVLDVFVRGTGSAERFFAEPVGAPMDNGFPLRLEPYEGPAPAAVRGPHAAAAEEPTDYTGRTLGGGKYRLDLCVGRGGMGEVYRAEHRDLHKDVAIKVLHPSFVSDETFASRFQAEALTMSKIEHPNVVRVIDFGQEPDGVLYLVMEFLDGRDLQAILDEEGPLATDRIVRLMSHVTVALGHVHRHGIIHRDVKPTNILVVAGMDEDDQPTETAKVCDFGIALARGSGGRVAGTPEYMSPEQCRGAELDARSDVYACGVILYELATGKLPFDSADSAEVMRMHMGAQAPPPSMHRPDLDPLLEQIILKALSKDPAARQATMRHLRHELRELLAPVLLEAEGPESIPGSSPAPSAARPLEQAARAEPKADSGPSWMMDREEGYNSFFTSIAEQSDAREEAEQLVDVLARDPGPWLSDLTATIDPDAFTKKMELLKPAVRTLMARAETTPLAWVIQAMRRVVKDEGDASGLRVKETSRLLRIVRNAQLLEPIVDKALGGPQDPDTGVASIFVEAQAVGAEALLEGRDRHSSPAARLRFIALMRAIGPAALGLLRGALTASLERGERSGPVVEDYLHAIPPMLDEPTGRLVSEFLKGGSPTSHAAALVALTNLWGDAARSLLVAALDTDEGPPRVAAIGALRALRKLDAQVVQRLEPLVSGVAQAPEDVKMAAAVALGEVDGPAKAAATDVVIRAFRGAPGRSQSGNVVVALGRSLLVLGMPQAAQIIQSRAATTPEVVKRQLLALLAR
jgi:serine/threonine protein kinase